MSKDNVTRKVSIFINDKEVTNSLGNIEREMSKVRGKLRELKGGTEEYGEKSKKLKQDLEKLKTAQAAWKQEINGTTGVLGKISNALGPVGRGMLAAFSVQALVSGFVNGVKEAWQTVVKFNQGQADLAAVLGTNRVGIRNLTADAIKLGASTAYSATEVTELQTELARLGKTEKEIRGMTKAVLDSATALETGLGEAATLVGGQLNSYSEDAKEAGKYSDIMANSVNISATSYDSLITSLPKVSAVAAQEGVKFEKLNAIMGVLADQNIAAETAGTGFRNILLSAAAAGKPYEQMLQQIKNSSNQSSKAVELFGKENATVAVILANSTEKINLNTKALENSSGAASKLAAQKMDSLKGSVEGFSGAWEGFILSIENGDGLIAKTIRKLIDMGTALLNLITPTKRLSDELRDEQIQLNVLVNRITSSNISQEERLQLLLQLKKEYPDFIKDIDAETISNDELKKSLSKVNDQYAKRIILQKQQEVIDDIAKDQAESMRRGLEYYTQLEEKLAALKTGLKLKVEIDSGDTKSLLQSAENIRNAVVKKLGNGADAQSVAFLINQVKAMDEQSQKFQAQVDKEVAKRENWSKVMNTQTEAQRAATKATEDDTKAKAKNNEVATALAENELKELTYTKNRREAMGKDTYNVQMRIYQLQQQLYKDDRDKYEEATNGIFRLQSERNKKLQEEEDKAKEIYDKAEQEIDAILLKAQQERILSQLKGIKREEQLITNKYAAEIEKYKGHAEKIKLLEAARDQEITDMKVAKAIEYEKRAQEIIDENYLANLELKYDRAVAEAATDEERQQILLDKAREVANEELQIELDKVDSEVENLEEAEKIKDAIKEKYRIKADAAVLKSTEDYKKAKKQELKWTEMTEEQKVEFVRSNVDNVAEAFNRGSNAWKAAKIAETGITTYQAAMEVYRGMAFAFPGPVGIALGAVAAAATTARGIKAMQSISATKIEKQPTYYYGGWTGDKPLYHDEYGAVVGGVHENEWVGPAYMTQDPKYADTFKWLENERQGRFGTGGSTTTTPPPRFTSGQSIGQDSSKTDALLEAVLYHLQNPVSPNLVVGYKNVQDLEDMKNELKQSGSFGTLNG